MRSVFCLLPFGKGFKPLCSLIAMCYQNDGQWRREFYTLVAKENGMKYYTLTGNVRQILNRAFQHEPEAMEEVVGHSLTKAATNIEFIVGAAKWLRWHYLILDTDEKIYGFDVGDMRRWVPIF